MDGKHSCFGCRKSFNTQKQLHAHQARCEANKRLKANLTESQKRLNQVKSKATEPVVQIRQSERPLARNNEYSTHSDWFIGSTSPELNGNQGDDEPGPSGYIPPDPDIEMSEPPEPPPVTFARSGRRVRLPARYTDFLPTGDGPDHVPSKSPPSSPEPEPSRSERAGLVEYQTQPDSMGLFRIYPARPTLIPTGDGDIHSVVDAPTLEGAQQTHHQNYRSTTVRGLTESEITPENLYAAFSSPTAGLLMCWQYSGSNAKSASELNRLWSFVKDPRFNASLEDSFTHEREKKNVEKYLQMKSNPFNANHGWKTSSLPILLPHERSQWPLGEKDPSVPILQVGGVYHRDITNIIIITLQDKITSSFHITPFEEYWQPNANSDPIRVFSEVYTSPEHLDAYLRVNSLPREPGDDLERVVIPLMLWSDATHLTSFGDASLWPIYLFFGNQSKYTRGKPSADACHHVAYIPSLPDNFQDEYSQYYREASSDEVYTHCKRELMQAMWRLLLDEKFVQAYKFGLVIKFADGNLRRAFPRFYTYAADYPEKVLLACIKFLGICLCPRCLVKKADASNMGTPSDMGTRETNIRVDSDVCRKKIAKARKLIFKHGASINGARIQSLLRSESFVPTNNAFSERLSDEEWNFFLMFVVDLLHEFELGVWKAVFIHLMRILYAAGGTAVQRLNYRYRKVPTFGRGTIRRFHKNASAMKRLAARDFEDLLQCAIPVFEGLLSAPHNEIVLDMLFDLATWHAFGKLRLHTEHTLSYFDAATTYLGKSIRKFQRTTCNYFQTTELPQEHAARGRRTAALAAQQGRAVTSGSHPKTKKLNLLTYKFHALGDYVNTIRRFGTTDNYTTQTGELEHRRSKRRFPRSGKQKANMVKSIANQEAIERFIKKVDTTRKRFNQQVELDTQPRRIRTPPSDHYFIAQSSRRGEDLTAWLGIRKDDPAFKDFLPRLKDHLLARARGLVYDGDEHNFSDNDRMCINIKNNQMHHHALLRVNYTTYDLRCDQDTINPLSRPDVMVLSHDDERSHPYWYARIIHIFHVMAQHRDNPRLLFSAPMRMDILFVRWFCRDVNYLSGWNTKRLHRLQFFDQENSSDAFGFLDPDCIVRGVHLIPAFEHDLTQELLPGPSLARCLKGDPPEYDWKYYYINMFVDRDMFMRYRGGGIGHKATRDWDEVLFQDSGKPVEDEEEDTETQVGEPLDEPEGEEVDEEEEWAGIMETGDDSDNNVSDGGESESSDDEEPDRVVADEGEELDVDILAREGYDAL